MTHNTIDMATASKPDTADLPLTTESANEQASSRFYPNGYNYDDAIPSVIQFYTGMMVLPHILTVYYILYA